MHSLIYYFAVEKKINRDFQNNSCAYVRPGVTPATAGAGPRVVPLQRCPWLRRGLFSRGDQHLHENLPEQSCAVAASEADRYKLYFYLNPEVLSCKKTTIFLGAFDTGTVPCADPPRASFSSLYIFCLSRFPVTYKRYRWSGRRSSVSLSLNCVCFRLATHQPGARRCAAFMYLPPSPAAHADGGEPSARRVLQLPTGEGAA